MISVKKATEIYGIHRQTVITFIKKMPKNLVKKKGLRWFLDKEYFSQNYKKHPVVIYEWDKWAKTYSQGASFRDLVVMFHIPLSAQHLQACISKRSDWEKVKDLHQENRNTFRMQSLENVGNKF